MIVENYESLWVKQNHRRKFSVALMFDRSLTRSSDSDYRAASSCQFFVEQLKTVQRICFVGTQTRVPFNSITLTYETDSFKHEHNTKEYRRHSNRGDGCFFS